MAISSHPSDIQKAGALVHWYRDNARDLPWRRTTDPYRIWLSEIMLQQTTVQQGEPYYHRFLEALPDVHALAAAPQDQVLKLWEGLGYYSRARNLHATAQHVVEELGGQFPKTYDGLLKLKGVGPYTAAAIASFAFGLPHVVVDGNVLRVMSRLHGIEEPVDIPATKKVITQLAQTLLETQDPAEFNQAIMELGALCCTFKKPDCEQCPLAYCCTAKADGTISLLPIKSKKIKKRTRHFWFYHVTDADGDTLLEQRGEGDVWQGLYQFPLVETDTEEAPPLPPYLLERATKKHLVLKETLAYTQLLTHQKIKSKVLRYVHGKRLPKKRHEGHMQVHYTDLGTYAFPKTLNTYLEQQGLK